MQTETGTPVQFLSWSEPTKSWHIYPAIIYRVEESVVDILFFQGRQTYINENVWHEDFREIGRSYWRHLPMKDGGQFTNEVKP